MPKKPNIFAAFERSCSVVVGAEKFLGNWIGAKEMLVCYQSLTVGWMKYLPNTWTKPAISEGREWLHSDPIVNEYGLSTFDSYLLQVFLCQEKEHQQKKSNNPFKDIHLCGMGCKLPSNTFQWISENGLRQTEMCSKKILRLHTYITKEQQKSISHYLLTLQTDAKYSQDLKFQDRTI